MAANEKIGFLGLLDSFGGEYPKRRKDLNLQKRVKLILRRFLPFGEEDAFNLDAFKRGLKDWPKRRLFKLGLLLNVRAPRRPYRLRFLYLQVAGFRARRRYKLKAFPGKIDLFRSEYQPPSDLFEPDPLLGWSGMGAGGIELHQLPGGHSLYLREPNVAILARKLQACLIKTSQFEI